MGSIEPNGAAIVVSCRIRVVPEKYPRLSQTRGGGQLGGLETHLAYNTDRLEKILG